MPGPPARAVSDADRLGRLRRAPPSADAPFDAGASVTRAEGADTGSVARRRVPGTKASRPPIPMSRPPAHSQATRGSITTPIATESAGRLLMAWLPEVAPRPPTSSKVR